LNNIILRLGQRASIIECPADMPPPPEVTHLIVRDNAGSVKGLCMLLSGRWIVKPEYLYASRDLGFWANEDDITGSLRCIQNPLREELVVLAAPPGPLYDGLRQSIVYAGGIMVDDAAALTAARQGAAAGRAGSIRRGKYIVIHTAHDIMRLCLQ
jgi:hypothetical protein